MISQALFIQHSRAKTLLSGLPAAGGSCMVVQAKSDPPPTHQSPLAGGPGGVGGPNVSLANHEHGSMSYCRRKCMTGLPRGQVAIHGEQK